MTGKRHWILLRGLGRDKRHWGEFVAHFADSFADDKVTTLDTCGNGCYADMKSPLSIKGYTEHCRELLTDDELPVHLVALSLGGMIAMDWTQRYPDEVASVTLINTSAANLTSMFQRINLKTLAKLVTALLFSRRNFDIEKAIYQATSNNRFELKTVEKWQLFRDDKTTSISNLLRQLFAASRFKLDELAVSRQLVLVSRNDRLVSSNAGVAIAEHLKCQIKYHSDAGHDLPLDDGQWIIDQIKMSLIGHKTERICQ